MIIGLSGFKQPLEKGPALKGKCFSCYIVTVIFSD